MKLALLSSLSPTDDQEIPVRVLPGFIADTETMQNHFRIRNNSPIAESASYFFLAGRIPNITESSRKIRNSSTRNAAQSE